MKEKTKKKTTGEKFKLFFTSNWLSKLASLFIAIGVWYTIFTHLEKNKPSNSTPVPGTTIPIPKIQEPEPKLQIPLLSPSTAIPGGN